MELRRIVFAIFLLCVPVCCAAQASAPASVDLMGKFGFVVGVWQPVPDAAQPAKVRETLTYASIHDGKFVTSQQIYRDAAGKIIYKDFAVFGEDPDTHKLFFHAYNTDGSIDRSREIESPADQWIFLGTVFGSPKFKDYRYTMTKLNEDHLRILIELEKDGKFEKLSESTYQRISKNASSEIQ